MEKDNKWGMFRNFMYNELGISKEDIRVWIKEAVHEEAKKMIEHTFDNFDVEGIIRQELSNKLSQSGYGSFKAELADSIVKKLKITFND